MNPKDKRTSRPAYADGMAAPGAINATPPSRGEDDDGYATKPDTPAAKRFGSGAGLLHVA